MAHIAIVEQLDGKSVEWMEKVSDPQYGVTQEELIETITHLAFYCGWPNAVSAINVAREVFEKK